MTRAPAPDPRPLGDMVAEIGAGAMQAAAGSGLRVTGLSVTLPVEFRLLAGGALAGDLPRTVTRTDFDAPPGSLSFTLAEAPA